MIFGFCFLLSFLDNFCHFARPQYEYSMGFFLVHLLHIISSAWYLRCRKGEKTFQTKINKFLWVDELKSGKGRLDT